MSAQEPAINQHLKRIFFDNELEETAVVKQYLITAADGKSYQTKHYNLQAIIAVGFKIENERAEMHYAVHGNTAAEVIVERVKSLRKQIQEKLIKFATRVPLFMYLTDYRERSLKDVITQLEPGLFKKVTGLNIPDFELLVSLGVFNAALMNDAVYKFKRYEDSSLNYTGIDKYGDNPVGLYDTVISRKDYDKLAVVETVDS